VVSTKKKIFVLSAFGTFFFAIFATFEYVNSHPEDQMADVMGSIAAAGQIISLGGGIYDLKRAVSMKTTEYIPAAITFGIFGLSVQWTIFAILVQNKYMLVANIAGLLLNIATLILYVIYPPRTWKVPLFGVGKIEEKKD